MTTNKSTWEQFHDLEAPVYDDLGFTKNTVKEVDFLIEVLDISPGDSILDIGCGTGRHSIELAKRGYFMTGIDFSEGMLAKAKEKSKTANVQVEWIHEDATKFSLKKKFDAAIGLCGGGFGLLGSGDDAIEHPLTIIHNVSRSLKPTAKTLFAVLNGFWMTRNHSQEDVAQNIFDPLTLSKVSQLSPVKGSPTLKIRERTFVPTELILLFQLAGMKVLDIWGGWNQQKIGLDEIEILVMAEKNAEQVGAPDVHSLRS